MTTDANDFSLDAVLADWHSNERDITMCENAIANNWTTLNRPHYVLSECYRMKPLIEKKIQEAGGAVPMSDKQKIEQLTASVAKLEKYINDHNKNVTACIDAYGDRDLENDPNAIRHWNDGEGMNA